MANEADDIVVGASGSVNFAPVGTAGPTDLVTALNVAFVDAGYLTEEGVTFDPSVDITEIPAWQSQYAVRRFVASRSFDITFTMLQMSKANFIFAMGGGDIATATGVHTYTPPTASDVDERALVVAWQDGSKNYRFHTPRGMVSDLATIQLQRTDASGLDVTFSVLASDAVASFTILSDDPAWA